jgi:hypothetical protein
MCQQYIRNVLVALIAALGTVVVALVGIFASRMESRDARARLMKDLEISSKLETESLAWRVMDSHIARVAEGLVDRERRRDEQRNARRMVYVGIFSAIVVLALALIRDHRMITYLPVIDVCFNTAMVCMVVFPLIGIFLVVRGELQRRQRTPGRELVDDAEPQRG